MSAKTLGWLIFSVQAVAYLEICYVIPCRYVLRSGRFWIGVLISWGGTFGLVFCSEILGWALQGHVPRDLTDSGFVMFAFAMWILGITVGWWQGIIVSGIAFLVHRRRRRLKEQLEGVRGEEQIGVASSTVPPLILTEKRVKPMLKRLGLFLAAIFTISLLCIFFHILWRQQTIAYPDGAKYVGTVLYGRENGQGKKTWADGTVYVGEFQNGDPKGLGTLSYPDGRKYVGEFGFKGFDGQGAMTWPDGRKYFGQFRSGKMDGIGKMTYPNGKVEEGLWKDDKFLGAPTPP